MTSMAEATSVLPCVFASLVTRNEVCTTDVCASVCEYIHLHMNVLYEYGMSYQLGIGDW